MQGWYRYQDITSGIVAGLDIRIVPVVMLRLHSKKETTNLAI